MGRSRLNVGPFHIDAACQEFHDHRRDPACRGRYMMRLPDGALAWRDEYEQLLRKFLVDRDKQQDESDDCDAGVRDHPRNG